MKYNQRMIGILKFLISLPFTIISLLPFFSFTAFIATSTWIFYMLPLYILMMIYLIIYGHKCLHTDNSAIITLIIIFSLVAFNILLRNPLSYQIYLIGLCIAFMIQSIQGLRLLIQTRKKIHF